MPDGNTVEYTVPVVQVQKLTCDDILQKHLLFLLPYHVIIYRDMVELIIRIADYVFRDKEKVKKGFGDVMGGKVLELESDKLIQRGIERGLEQGLEKGIQQGIAMERKNTELVRRKAEEEIQRLKKLLEEQNNK